MIGCVLGRDWVVRPPFASMHAFYMIISVTRNATGICISLLFLFSSWYVHTVRVRMFDCRREYGRACLLDGYVQEPDNMQLSRHGYIRPIHPH